MRKKLTLIMAALLGALLIACTAVTEPEPAAAPETVDETAATPAVVEQEQPTPESETEPGEDMSEPIIPEASRPMLDKVRQDLAELRNADAGAIRTVSVQAVEWADSSMGCPQPDMMYLMVITPGYYIVLELDGQEYNYHTDESRYFVLCEDGDASPPFSDDQ